MKIEDLRKLVKRAFPGLGGWQYARFARVVKVYSAQGIDTQLRPLAVVDLVVLDADLARDPLFKGPLRKVTLSAPSVFEYAPPELGDVALISFGYWRADRAIVTGFLHRNRLVKVEPGTWRIAGPMVAALTAKTFVELGSAEDFAVLGSVLIETMVAICDQIELLGAVGNLGAPLGNLATVQANLTQIKLDLPNILSTAVKVGQYGS